MADKSTQKLFANRLRHWSSMHEEEAHGPSFGPGPIVDVMCIDLLFYIVLFEKIGPWR